MEHKYRKAIALAVSMAVLLPLSTVNLTQSNDKILVANAEETALSGKCGDNAIWTYDEDTATLTISGTGEMYDYGLYPFDDTPGYIDMDANVKKIVVEEGITSIGDFAFNVNSYEDHRSLYTVESISLPSTITKIGMGSFSGYLDNLKTTINIPDGVTEIGDSAFLKWHDTNPVNEIKNIVVPASVETIGEYAIGYISCGCGANDPEEDFVIEGYTGSQAETYAKENGITFVALGDGSTSDNLSGKCGDNATWSYDEDTATLTISGTGAIYDYDCPYFDQSWFGAAGGDDSKVKNIVIEEGITSIGTWAFAPFTLVKSVKLPNTLTEIGDYAFQVYNYYPETQDQLFLPEITIPSSVKKIGTNAIGYFTFGDGYDEYLNGVVINGFFIKGYTGSQAETYANENIIYFVALEDDEITDTTTDPEKTVTTTDSGKTVTTTDSGKTVTTTAGGVSSPGTSDKGVTPLLLASVVLGATAVLTSKRNR
jgi:hypothetical protein